MELYEILRSFGTFYLNAEAEGDLENYIADTLLEIKELIADRLTTVAYWGPLPTQKQELYYKGLTDARRMILEDL